MAILFLLTGLGLVEGLFAQSAVPADLLHDGDRVVFVGDTLLEREGTQGFIEHRLTTEFAARNLSFRNVSWSADLPTGQSRASFDWIKGEQNWFTNLLGQIAAAHPNVVCLGYGMAVSFAGPSGVKSFVDQMERLMAGIRSQSGTIPVRFLILGPVRHEDKGSPLPDPTTHNTSLALYNQALKTLARMQGAGFVDLFTELPLPSRPAQALTDNGIHLNALGSRRAAQVIGSALAPTSSVPRDRWTLHMDAGAATPLRSEGIQAREIALQAGALRFSAQPERVGMPPDSDSVTEIPLAPSVLAVKGLKAGRYVLRVDGEDVVVRSQSDWAKGVEIASGPLPRQARELHAAILKKNELFFHRWRPENSTYLFLFRKGEQGRNAVEIPQFDPLIAEQEQRIATLKQARSHRFELVPVPRDYVAAAPPAAPAPSKPKPLTPQPRPSFDLAPGLVATLYAEDPLLHKPIHMNFDAKGRLWVASSSLYPQIKPGQEADDTLIVLEDRDGDGVAETSKVFADGLLIPTAVEPGDGGVYVGQSTELLFFKDTDGDGKADVRRTVLSGFGTEDTHHILHTLHWGMDGLLYMNQSIYIHTHTETPNGVMRLNSGGILSLRPSTLEMGIHMKGLVNTWGHQMDLYGQSFATDGAGIEGINYIVPQAMYFTYAGARRILGSVSPGIYPKFCSLEILHSPLFPKDWQGSMITCDFRAHRVVRFSIQEKGSAYVTQEMPEIVRSQDPTFRPIDVKLGPDGALYVADWSNPIIQHGEVDFRDARRDKEHGRIWRITHKDTAPMPKSDLTTASNPELFAHLIGPSGFHREKARRVLAERGKSVLKPLKSWLARQTDERASLEVLWLHQSVDEVNSPLLEKLLASKDGRIRAAAVRVLAAWGHRINPGAITREQRFLKPEQLTASQSARGLDLLSHAIADEHPRVRLEALRALPHFPGARAAELALSVLDHPMDPHLEYAAWLTINDLAEPWLAALKSGSWTIAGREKQLEYGLRALEPARAGAVLGQILEKHPLDKEGSGNWIELIGQSGQPGDLSRVYAQVLAKGFSEAATARALTAIDQAARLRSVRPQGDLSALATLFSHANPSVQKAAIRLAGAWKLPADVLAALGPIASAASTSAELRAAVFETLRDVGGDASVKILTPLCDMTTALDVRRQAIPVLTSLRPEAGGQKAVGTLMALTSDNEAQALWRALLSIKGSAAAITRNLPKTGIPPLVAKAGLRAARESGRSEPDLVLALTRGADLAEGEASLSEAELKAMAADVVAKGDPQRGEAIYRRSQLSCVSCHSIGGAGGKVGPDMTSIGASAPVDYLIESVWFPNRKVKEGFHSLLIETKDGQELSGLLVRETGEQMILRDTQGGEFSVAKNNIEKRRTGGSLMPAGLIDGLQPQERLDLFRFLSELGKPGPFDASKGTVARGWKLRPGTHQDEQFGVEKMVALSPRAGGWLTAWSLVDGRLPLTEIQQAANVERYIGLVAIYATTQLDVAKAGPVRLHLEGMEGASVWIDGKALPPSQAGNLEVNLAAGSHPLMVRMDPKKLPPHLRVGTSDGTFVIP